MEELLKSSGFILSSGLLGSLLTFIFTRYDGDKKVITEHVTKERQLWREKIRSLVIEVTDAYQLNNWDVLQGIQTQFHVLINPYDKRDQELIETLESIRLGRVQCESSLLKFNILASKLLKHDWERVKSETSFFVTARGLFLASVVLVITAQVGMFVLKVFDVVNPTLIVCLAVIFVFSLPILYERLLTILNDLLCLKHKKMSKLISWLKNEPYRDGIEIEHSTHSVTISNAKGKDKYLVRINKIVS